MTEFEVFRKRTITLLGQIINRETEKSDDEANFELIEECEQLLEILIDGENKLTDEELQRKLEQITNTEKIVIGNPLK